ncbi:YoaK family protein [Ferruginibacter sp. HRS2-29]|uniref:YoaK family protein n=1 Tax=Ferruginibacter sp. HRS2-29 TaxID=2487334 RepID=UPI0020CD505C|nr:YoaK family protein [Ferruginibacter sp. HRS2-29]MCP9749743.1 DUF1275 domain-containing protein [Ferruginibacter sp. HRS2-29]
MNQAIPSALNDQAIVSQKTGVQERMAIFLALIAGYIDAIGFIKWRTYVSFMSGNTTQLGFNLSQKNIDLALPAATAIGSFVTGIFLGTSLSMRQRPGIRPVPFMIVAGLLLMDMILAFNFTIPPLVSIAMISLAMGFMNTILTTVGKEKVNTDFVTGTLNSLARQVAMAGMTSDRQQKQQHKTTAWHLLLIWGGFVAGAFSAAFCMHQLDEWALGFPALLLLSGIFLWHLLFTENMDDV